MITSERSADWKRVSKSRPCIQCGKGDFCTFNETLGLTRCMRLENDHPSPKGGWIYRIDGTPRQPPRPTTPPPPAKTDAEYAAIWEPRCRARRINQNESIDRLATILGVARESLDLLRVGYDERERCWWMPERNHEGRIVGVNRRFEDGSKLCGVGSRRGLTFSDDWRDWPGPCHLVEGASDVAACLTIGLCAVGRPSNLGGAEYLAQLLAGFDREIIVLGERDKRPHDSLTPQMQVGHEEECMGCARCHPGLYGMEKTAEELRKRLKRSVSMAFPPGTAKDVRSWLNSQRDDVDLLELWKL
jgi:ferredoxin